jgi:hypothetical protein
MKRLMISALAAVALLAATTATAMLYSPSTKLSAGTAMPSLHELHVAAGVNKLPIEDVEDMSLSAPLYIDPASLLSKVDRSRTLRRLFFCGSVAKSDC